MWKKIKSHPWWLALGSVFIALALFAGWQLWGKAPATDNQKKLIRKRGRKYLNNSDIDIESLTKFEASQILNRIMKG